MTRPTVLVVEDNAAMREFLANALRRAGFDVQTATDGLAALQSVERARPDAVLLDLDLPIMNGFAVHTALQSDERTRGLPIVIVTGTGWSGPIPVAATLLKPIPVDDLVHVMFDVIARGEKSAEPDSRDDRTIVWLCPTCRTVVRESHEPGHPMTSEMRTETHPCVACADPSPAKPSVGN